MHQRGMTFRARWCFVGVVLQVTLLACSAGTEGDDDEGSGGRTPKGGAPNQQGGAPGSGGTGNGGTTSMGGTGTGGSQQGGNTGKGGSQQGGSANGGSSTGGASAGGKSNTGGTANGGSGSGGKSSGGTSAGGASSGGTGSGGKASGGASAGGASSGGSGSGGKASGGAANGGSGTGGKANGGAPGAGGKAGTGGTTNTGAGPTVTCGCTTSSGEFSGNNIKSTIVIDSGENYDGGCKTFRADPGSLGPGDQSEGQEPIFRVNGGTLSNVILGASAADGIHIYGNTTLKNIHWLDIGEDAMTIKDNATMTLDCGSSDKGSDKTFQVNAEATITIRNFTAKNAGKFMRQNGDSTFKMTVTIDHCDISNMAECIYRTDSSSSIVNMTNTRYRSIGDSLFIFGSTNVNGDTHNQVGTFSGNQAY
ncbi:MAG: pectate lyase [Myxococcota bacterium]